MDGDRILLTADETGAVAKAFHPTDTHLRRFAYDAHGRMAHYIVAAGGAESLRRLARREPEVLESRLLAASVGAYGRGLIFDPVQTSPGRANSTAYSGARVALARTLVHRLREAA